MVEPATPQHSQSPHSELANRVVVMAHDLKNVLAALSANLHFLESCTADGGDAEAADALSDSLTLCQVLDHFLRNLDLIGREDMPTLTVHKTLTSLRAIADDVSSRFQRQAETAGIQLQVHGDRDAHAFVDRELFTRAADNLLRTAIEQCKRGAVITLAINGDGQRSALSVSGPWTLAPTRLGSGADAHPPNEKAQGRGLGMYCALLSANAAGAELRTEWTQPNCSARLTAPAKP